MSEYLGEWVGLKFAPVLESAKLNYTYTHCIYHSSKIAKAGPVFDDRLEHPPAQIFIT